MAFNPNFYGNYYPNGNFVPNSQPQIQNNGFVMVRSEMEARNFPVALGNSVTFKDETAPYIYSKTMGFSQLDRPIFEKYKLVKEEIKEVASEPTTIDGIRTELGKLWAEIEMLKEKNNERYAKHNGDVGTVQTESNADFVDAV